MLEIQDSSSTRIAHRERTFMETMVNGIKLILVQGDITEQSTDAIVNAANSSLMGGGGVDGAIHSAGGPAIIEECRQIVARQGRLPTGRAVITTGGNLRAKYVIHTVGPVWRGGSQGESDLLASAYTESLKIANEKKLASVSFPSISTGAYGYPVDEAAEVALSAVISFLKQKRSSLEEVVFVLYGRSALEVYERALKRVSLP
jgi:O-acetyl-ADP-ribose deacetylase